MIRITPSNTPTVAIEVMLNRRTINEINSQATPVTRNSHHGNIEAPRTRMLTAPSPRTVRPRTTGPVGPLTA